MPNHQASEQMLGYLYQVRYALALLLENDNSDIFSTKATSQMRAQICGEP